MTTRLLISMTKCLITLSQRPLQQLQMLIRKSLSSDPEMLISGRCQQQQRRSNGDHHCKLVFILGHSFQSPATCCPRLSSCSKGHTLLTAHICTLMTKFSRREGLSWRFRKKLLLSITIHLNYTVIQNLLLEVIRAQSRADTAKHSIFSTHPISMRCPETFTYAQLHTIWIDSHMLIHTHTLAHAYRHAIAHT